MRAYTKMNTFLKKIQNKFGVSRQRHLKEIELMYGECKAENNPHGRYQAISALNGFYIDVAILDGKAIHIFMPDSFFCEWIVSCVPCLEPSHVEIIQEMQGANACCLHFPVNSKKPSFAFSIFNVADKEKILCMSFSTDNSYGLEYRCIPLESNPSADRSRWQSLWYAKLVVGLGMYLSCFPDQIKPGIPEDLKHPNHFKGLRARTIGISEKVVMRDGPTPHYRVGHFRFLESERYKNKRGQAVFVHGCFVKGKAETVLALS